MSTVVVIAVTIFWLWALVDVLSNDFKNNNKLIWLLTVILVPVVGVALYFLIGRTQKIPAETETEVEAA
ncbi:MAG: PLDc_N domain-containing protein [Deltaproteobacteria bacterium]|jgi:uncharacterized protein YhhL (DUF1145 family)|nr:PLDc_N domain-containing protein [Deltaproteobacteria bacterium]